MKIVPGGFQSRREAFNSQRYVNIPRQRKKRQKQAHKPFKDYFNGDDAS